jgi:biopolymer transport protein ExbD
MTIAPLTLAPLAALFLMLAAVVAASHPTSKGFPLKTSYVTRDCYNRTVVVEVIHNGLSINARAVKRDELDDLLRRIFKTREERVLYVRADPDVAFERVADAIDICIRQADHVVLLTPSVRIECGAQTHDD